ncbi:mechanosensitive ion channel domain-containing protein [Pelagibius sp. Alg239-R121]|uniref:mechanosensitive ion channel domain-containing protein n=1 Tax=Pelagibius sp. Alg239-R121 TaxID=2993448 RepID=UPI0024A645A4|nr:mechanosensitive ion channel domain-containing protein [Pelagibius sp. Alg239-R121]
MESVVVTGILPWVKAHRNSGRAIDFSTFLLVAFLICVPFSLGQAQTIPGVITESTQKAESELSPLAEDLTSEERSDLLARLSDGQVRQLLIDYLDQRSGANADGDSAGMVSDFDSRAHIVRERLADVLHSAPRFPELISETFAHIAPPGRGSEFLFILLAGFAFIFGAGAIAEFGFRHLTQKVRNEISQATPATTAGKAGYLILRVLLDFVAVAIFALVALACFFAVYQGYPPVRLLVLTMVGAAVVYRVISVISRFLLAPLTPSLRCLPFEDTLSKRLHSQFMCLALFSFFFMGGNLLRAFNMDPDLTELYHIAGGAVFSLLLIGFIWRDRRDIAGLIGNTDEPTTVGERLRAIFGQIWHLLAVAYVVAIFLIAVTASLIGHDSITTAAMGSLVIIIAVPLVDYTLRQMIGDAIAPESAGHAYLPILFRAIRLLLVILGVLIFARLWGIDVFAISTGGLGASAIRAIVEIGFTILLAYVIWQVAQHAIDRRIKADGGGEQVESEGEGGGKGATRLATLLPLLRKFLFITILVMAVMVMLSALGVNVGPLLAGAGVIGIAIGFGAQTLVKDIVSGVFFLVDDAFRLGEYVDIGDVKGTVEAINVRSLVLRHHRGPLHTVPFGEIKYLTNYSRDWVIMKLEFRVTYDTDINKVKKIFKRIGAELLEDEILGAGFLEPLKSQGVKAMEDSAMILRAKFKAKPGEQFMIRKEVYRRVQEAFHENGIHFAHRRVLVDVPDSINDNPEMKKRIEEAAAAAMSDDGQVQGA